MVSEQLLSRRLLAWLFLLTSALLLAAACGGAKETSTGASTINQSGTPSPTVVPLAKARTSTRTAVVLAATPPPTSGTVRPSPTASPTPTTTPATAPTPIPTLAALPDVPRRSARIVVEGESLWAGHPASRTVTRLALPDGRRSWQTDVGCEPATLALWKPRLFFACFDSGEVVILEARTGAVVTRSWVGYGPFGLLPASGRLYLTLAHESALLALRPDTLSELSRVATGRQPRGLAYKGGRLYVVHLLDSSVKVFDIGALKVVGEVALGHQAPMAESVTPHRTLPRVFVPNQRQNVTNMARLFDTTVFPVVSSLDTDALRPIRRETLALDSVDTPVGMPIAVVLSPDGTRLYAVNAASDDVSVVDLTVGIGVGHIPVGHNPRDLALSADGGRIYTLNLVSDDITVIDTETMAALDTFPLADDPRPAIVQRGERLFLTSRPDEISRDNWMACASCHVDGGFDGRTWLGTKGGPRNTTTLRGIGDTRPLHWSADRPDVQSFQQTFKGLMAGTGLSESDLDALAKFLDGLQPLPSPLRGRDGSLSEEAVRGGGVFRRVGCAVCHAPPLFTDRQLHDVGTGEPFHDDPRSDDKVPETMGPAFDTPSLRELWMTGPFLHDGRATTLRDVLTAFNPDGRHGDTAGLSDAELSDLEAFLLSLPLSRQEQVDLLGE